MTVEKDQFRTVFRLVPQKLGIFGKNGPFRATSISVKVVGNAILGGVFFIPFFLQGFLLPILAFQKKNSWIFNWNEESPKINKNRPTSTVFSG